MIALSHLYVHVFSFPANRHGPVLQALVDNNPMNLQIITKSGEAKHCRK